MSTTAVEKSKGVMTDDAALCEKICFEFPVFLIENHQEASLFVKRVRVAMQEFGIFFSQEIHVSPRNKIGYLWSVPVTRMNEVILKLRDLGINKVLQDEVS